MVELIKVGTHITTLEGELVIISLHNNNAALCEEYELNYETEELELRGTFLLTHYDIESRMKDYDGKYHKIRIIEED